MLKQVQGLYDWGTCGAKITQAYDQRLKQWAGFTVSMEDYANEMFLFNLPPGRRADQTAPVTAYEQTLFRGLVGQLSWLAQQC